jgi:hypothetical protein
MKSGGLWCWLVWFPAVMAVVIAFGYLSGPAQLNTRNSSSIHGQHGYNSPAWRKVYFDFPVKPLGIFTIWFSSLDGLGLFS